MIGGCSPSPTKEHVVQFDSKSASLAAAAIAAVLASPLAANTGPASAPQFTAEKCYSVAAASQDDCQTSTHSCADESGRLAIRNPGSTFRRAPTAAGRRRCR